MISCRDAPSISASAVRAASSSSSVRRVRATKIWYQFDTTADPSLERRLVPQIDIAYARPMPEVSRRDLLLAGVGLGGLSLLGAPALATEKPSAQKRRPRVVVIG